MPPDGEQRVREIAKHVRAIMQALELDLDDPNLSGTPERVAHLYTELFAAAGSQLAPRLSSFPNAEHYAQMAFHDQTMFAEIYGPQTSFEQLEAWETDREMTSRVAWKRGLSTTWRIPFSRFCARARSMRHFIRH